MKTKAQLYREAQTKGDLDDHNEVMNKRKRIELQLKMFKGVSLPRVKDKYGNNIKQHFGLWKYFVDTRSMQREKQYISLDCRLVKGKEASRLSRAEAAIG